MGKGRVKDAMISVDAIRPIRPQATTTRACQQMMKFKHACAHGRQHQKPKIQPSSLSPLPTPDLSASDRETGSKSNMYQVAWSLEEQHLLERLLE
jgi:hypothetical protein